MEFNTGVVAKDMLVGKVTCLFKKGDPMSLENYRSIFVLPILSKVLEKLIFKRVMNPLEHHNYLTGSQHGFRTQCSTEEALHFSWYVSWEVGCTVYTFVYFTEAME